LTLNSLKIQISLAFIGLGILMRPLLTLSSFRLLHRQSWEVLFAVIEFTVNNPRQLVTFLLDAMHRKRTSALPERPLTNESISVFKYENSPPPLLLPLAVGAPALRSGWSTA
jgi:hypothetical protein